MKKILYILEAVEGGAWRHLRDLIETMHGRLFDCSVVLSFARDCGNVDEVRSFLAAKDVALYELAMKRGAAPGDMLAVLSLTKLIRRLKPDLVHAHSAKAGFLGRIAARLAGVSCVYTPHCFPFQMEGGKQIRAYEFAEKGVVGISAAVIVISREEENAALMLGHPRSRVHYVPNGIESCGLDLPEICDHAPLSLGFFGREGDQKGADTFVRLVAELNRRGVAAEGRVFGNLKGQRSKSSLSRRSRTQSAKTEIQHSASCDVEFNNEDRNNSLRFYGLCPQEQVVPRMRECDVIVMPSRWEGLPYVLLEALDAGVPVSAFGVGGIGDVVEHGVSAMLAEPGDFGGLVENTVALCDAGVRRRLAEGGRRAVHPFTLQRMADGTAGVYRGVLAAPPVCRLR